MTRATLEVLPPAAPRAQARKPGTPTGEEQRIAEMLSYRRPHGSLGELEFLQRFILPLEPEVVYDDSTPHAYVVRIPGNEARLKRAFCAHVDSVHNRVDTGTRQPIGFDTARHEFYVSNPDQRDCLGADDAAGCYVLIRMIEAQVPGLYVFFRGEERGGIGSNYVASHRQDVFEGIEQAIQFDRRGTGSIITRMMCGRTCSDQFANALAEALDMGHEIDPTGSFTDTANLSEFIPECTNVSVGYDHEHSASETLDVFYLLELVDHCIDAFSDSGLDLPTVRLPGEFGRLDSFDDDLWPGGYGTSNSQRDVVTWDTPSVYELPEMTRKEIRTLVLVMSTNEIVDWLYEAGEAISEAYSEYYATH